MLLKLATANSGAPLLIMDLPIEEAAPIPEIATPPGEAIESAGNDLDENARSIALMSRVKTGDTQAFEQLVVIHQGAVIGTVAKMLGDATEAHDVAQQVFIRVWKSAPRYEPKAKFTTWLYTITRNLVFNESRRRSRRQLVSSDEREEEFHLQLVDEGARGPSEDLEKKELMQAIDDAIQSLPEKQRMAVVLRRYEGLPYDEIAKVLKTSVSSVKSLLFRARTQLKVELAKHLADES
ncbi:MAG: RNA polymerase sigma-70 factor (ECF subfamily) [Pseudoalteromonas tetraodonis]|jgi:RNA polymerase sigma-70 factor (ECF subfamily)